MAQLANSVIIIRPKTCEDNAHEAMCTISQFPTSHSHNDVTAMFASVAGKFKLINQSVSQSIMGCEYTKSDQQLTIKTGMRVMLLFPRID